MTVSCGLCGQRGIVGESGEAFGLGTITVLGSRCLPPPLPRWASPGGPPPQGGRPPKGGVGGGPRAPGRWWRRAPGGGWRAAGAEIFVVRAQNLFRRPMWLVRRVCTGLSRLGRLASGSGRPSRRGWLELAGGGRASVQGHGFADARFPRAMPWMARFPGASPRTDAAGSDSRGSPGPSSIAHRQEP